MKEGDHSPWGKIQFITPVMPGMDFVSTAGHGGIKLSRELNAKMPAYLRLAGGWYEEDCEWAMVFCVFEKEILETQKPSHIEAICKGEHKACLKNWNPAEYEKFYGVTLKPGESHIRDQEIFSKEHANDFVVISAIGTENGMVRCTATRGGNDGPSRTYLIQDKEYKTRSIFGFVIDEQRHTSYTETGAWIEDRS